MSRLVEQDGWQSFDSQSNLSFPWYTRPFLKELITWDIKNWKVFEYGAGNSSIWWRRHARLVHSIDSNKNWATESDAHFENDKTAFLTYPLSLIDNERFDCIIIDGEPVEWRDECAQYALQCIKDGGIIIADNYNQATVAGLGSWPKTDEILKTYEKQVFKEPEHTDWSTAFWKIRKG